MAKTERLMKLIGLIRNRNVVSVAEMSEACGVSQRTIYRYLNTLTRMDIPLTALEGGGVQMTDETAADSGLTSEDMEILSFCLQNNPLARYDYFAHRLDRIQDSIGLSNTPKASLLETGTTTTEKTSNERESRLLEQFAVAKAQSHRLTVHTASGGLSNETVIPRSIKIDQSGVRLVVETEGKTRREINLNDVVRLNVMAEVTR
ncbi:MAG: HTH domain-containing protein [candidate division Zixibacteria bacterium]|nr:HTH domain-containing protein [candidate division Zixibacteria bacterium]